jgi:branched-chain amino acid aminotransferase
MRYNSSVLIFLRDHLERMRKGFERLQENVHFTQKSAISSLMLLVNKIGNFEGNIKLLGKSDEKQVSFACYGIPHHYPSTELYKKGIVLNTIAIERPNPSIKQVHVANSISKKISARIKDEIYESLLVDHNNSITEGSRSNFFLIHGNSLFSAPESKILNGITRRYILKIAETLNIPVLRNDIQLNQLHQFEAAFICGTSPKILPVRKINEIHFNPQHQIVNILIERYNIILKEQIAKNG